MKNQLLIFFVLITQVIVAYAQTPAPLPVEKDAAKVLTPSGSRIVEVTEPPKDPAQGVVTSSSIQSMTRTAPRKPAVRRNVSQPSTYAVAASRSLTLYVGEVRVIDRPNVVRVAVGNGQVASATVINEKQVVLLADASGATVLYFWLKDGSQVAYEVNVTPDQTAKVAQEVRQLLGAESGVQVRIEGSGILLEGTDVSADTAMRIDAVTKRYPQLINLVPARKLKVRNAAEQMIYLDVKVIEVRKKAADKLGIKWDASAAGPTVATSGYFYANSPFRGLDATFPATSAVRPFVSYFGLASQIASSLNFLEQSGDVWTLAEPRLSCKTGGKARSQVGGEIPIQVANGLGTNAIVYKPYGVILEFEPVSDDQGQVSSKITIEVSQPDARNSSAGATAFTQNRTETQVNLKDGETLVLAGLLSERGQKSRDAVPGLSKVPLLGALFRSNEYENDQTEVVVMVTPRIAEANARMNHNDMSTSNSALNKSIAKDGIEKMESINDFIKRKLAE
jgi:pilus assembly protein CpaC